MKSYYGLVKKQMAHSLPTLRKTVRVLIYQRASGLRHRFCNKDS